MWTLFLCIVSARFVNALNRGNVATVLVITSSTPVISALISRLLFKVAIDRSVMLASRIIMPLVMGLITLSTRFVSPANAGLFLQLETALAPLWMYLFLR